MSTNSSPESSTKCAETLRMLALAPRVTKYITGVEQMTAALDVTCKLGAAIDIATGPGLAEGIKTVINVFAFALSRGAPRLDGLK